jgi:hypothetical protein
MNAGDRLQLCITHSPLVTRVFEAAMRLRGIPVASVRSIGRRGAPLCGAGLGLDEVSDGMESCFRRFDRAGYAALQKRLDEALLGLTGGRPFEACVPHLNKMLYQEIISHPDCAAWSFLEEGFTSMTWETRRNRHGRPRKLLLNVLRALWVRPNYRFTRPMFDHSLPRYHAAFAVSRLGFEGMPGRINVSAHVPPLPAGVGPGKTYVVLDACYLHQHVRWEDYEDALVAAIHKNALPCVELFVKFHFADTMADQHFESIRRRLTGCGIPEPGMLPGDFTIEENLTAKDLLVFATTSLGYYTALLGGRVACFAGNIKGLSIPSWIAAGRLPGDFPHVAGLP